VPVAGSGSCDQYLQGDGVIYAKVSPSGKRSDRGGGFSQLAALPAHVAVADDTRHHFAYIRVSFQELVMHTFGFTAAGAPLELVDRFTISCPPDVHPHDAEPT
jgi:hypothetical protein